MYAKIIDGVFTIAPKKINRIIDGQEYTTFNPTGEMLVEQGWLPVVHTNPPNDVPEGWHYEDSFVENNGEIVQNWALVQDEITEEAALVRYANEVTGVDNPDLMSAAETMLKQLTEV